MIALNNLIQHNNSDDGAFKDALLYLLGKMQEDISHLQTDLSLCEAQLKTNEQQYQEQIQQLTLELDKVKAKLAIYNL